MEVSASLQAERVKDNKSLLLKMLADLNLNWFRSREGR